MRGFLQLFVVCVALAGTALGQQGTPISDAAWRWLRARVDEVSNTFFIFDTHESALNHGVSSGYFGSLGARSIAKIEVNSACVYDALSSNGCAAPGTFDKDGNTMSVRFRGPLERDEYLGVNVEEPEGLSSLIATWRGAPLAGYDLTGAEKVCFEAASPDGLSVRFGVRGSMTDYVPLLRSFRLLCFEFGQLKPPLRKLTDVRSLFTVVTTGAQARNGGTVLLRKIRFEPVPTSARKVLGFPVANRTYGISPARTARPEPPYVPPDQVNRNVATIYESSILLRALLQQRGPEDLARARRLADSFVAALDADTDALRIPGTPPAAALHRGYMAGPLTVLNDQLALNKGDTSRPYTRQGQIRVAGFGLEEGCSETRFCLVLDGVTGGENAFVILALLDAAQLLQGGLPEADQTYLKAARRIGNWIHEQLGAPESRYPGYRLGYDDSGRIGTRIDGKSIENNADILIAFEALAARERELNGVDSEFKAIEWIQRAELAGRFVAQMYIPRQGTVPGRFVAGTVISTEEEFRPGIIEEEKQKDSEVRNMYDFLDSQTFVILALAESQTFNRIMREMHPDFTWMDPVLWFLQHGGHEQRVRQGEKQFRGYSIVATPFGRNQPRGISWEFTGQVVVTLRLVGRLHPEHAAALEDIASSLVAEIRRAQISDDFAELEGPHAGGIVAATLENAKSIPLNEQCHSTPFQCMAARPGMAATVWGVFAEQNWNPLGLRLASPVMEDVPVRGTLVRLR